MNNKGRNTTDTMDRQQTYADEPLRETLGHASEATVEAAESMKESFGKLRQEIGGVRDSVVGKTKEYWHTTDGYVGRNPWVAVGISAGVAFLAGMLIGRRRSD